ncbi:MAG: flagellar motor protein MotB [Planctomycetota bacterium]
MSPEEHRRVTGANQSLKAEIASLTKTWNAVSQENERLRAELDRVGKQAADADWIREQKAKLDKLLGQYQDGAPSAVPGVELVQTNEGLAFRVLGGVLFAPGRIEISEQGKQTLAQLIDTLRREGKRVRVDGHTDDTPITHSRWGTNLRLSVERSLAVADFLIQSGLSADQVGVAGFGEYRPTIAATTDEARQKNRRVEILMLDRE